MGNAGRCGIDQWNFVLRPDSGASRDPEGKYVRKWCPELEGCPFGHLFTPWKATTISRNLIPRIVVNLQAARARTALSTLNMRRSHPEWNDSTGYDVIMLPGGRKTRVFTKKEYRLPNLGSKKVTFSA